MKKILGGVSVILLLGITVRIITGQQLKADDALQETTETSITTIETIPSSEAASEALIEAPSEEPPAEIPVIPENSKDELTEESVSEDTASLEPSTDSSSEESVESSTSSASGSTSGSHSTTESSTSSSNSTSTTKGSSTSSSTTGASSSSSSSRPDETKQTCLISETASSSEETTSTTTTTSYTEPVIPSTETTVGNPNPSGSIYSGLSGLSNTSNLALDQAYKTSDFADSELKGFELPLLSSFEDQRQAALIYEAIKQLSQAQEDSLTNESFAADIYQRVLQQDLTSLTEQKQSDDQLVAGDVLYFKQKEQKVCAGIYLGDGYLLSVKEISEKEGATHKTSESKAADKEKKAKKDSKKKANTPTEENAEKELETAVSKEQTEEQNEEKEAEGNERLLVQKTSDRDAKGEWFVRREATNTLTSYGQELLKEYPASMDFKASAQTQKFVETIGKDAQKLGQDYDVFASVMIAQAILESGSGTSGLSAAPHYNLFGIKGSYKGNAVNMATQEDGGSGNLYTIQSAFRSYPNYAASLGDYVELIRGGITGSENYYADVWRSKAKNYLRASEKLTGKYATDTSYHRKLASLISVYHLTQYDKQQVQAETPLSGAGTETGIFIKGKNEIPEEYAERMKYEDYNGVNYNKSGSYPVGQCTWYAFNRVAQLGKQVDDFMGNGGEWAVKGRALGYEVSAEPKAGRLISFKPGVAGSDPRYGHVAFVEAVGPNGILISEGNVYGGTVISYRVITNDLALSNQVSYVTPK